MSGLLVFSKQERLVVDEVEKTLYATYRTGWVDRGIKNPETVGQHTDETIAIGKVLFGVPGLCEMLKVHDWAESDKNVGDPRTDPNCPKDHKWSKEDKHRAELKAMEKICSRMSESGKVIMLLWL